MPGLASVNHPEGSQRPFYPLSGRDKIRPVLGALKDWFGKLGWFEVAFLVLVLVALGMRLWELGGRPMHYDEAIHLHYAWRLSNLEEYLHSPWMHGPFQIEFAAVIFRLFGDTDFTARLGYAFLGSALVGLPYFLRNYLGRAGALFAGVMLTLSPALLYFSRFGRNDIIMAFWATALLVIFWRYIHEDRDRYLYLAAAVLALMFATKETAYFVTLIFGVLAFLLALPQLTPLAFRRGRWSQLTGPAGFFILVLTLTLPQWSAASGLAQGFLGLTLVTPEGSAGGIVGAPQWSGPLVLLPVYHAPIWFHVLAAGIAVGGLAWLNRKGGLSAGILLPRIGVPLAVVLATGLAMFRPLGLALSSTDPPLLVDLGIAGALLVAAAGVLLVRRFSWQSGKSGYVLLLAPALLTLFYAILFTPIIDVDTMVNSLLPAGIQVEAEANGIPINFVVAAAILAVSFAISVVLGASWRGGVWVGCAVIFYLVSLALYTTLFTNWAGFFSGIWQGMGYWIAQQEVARGNQPWYYYFVGLSVYELLPVLFGGLGAIYFFRRGDAFGLALAWWAGLSLLAYTLASEKMPWLLVNITLPFILLAGYYLGELVQRVRWSKVFRLGTVALLVIAPLLVLGGVYLIRTYVNPEGVFSGVHWLLLLSLAGLAIAAAFLVRRAQPPAGAAMVGLGIAALLLAFGTWGAFRAAYTFDDSNREILVYAQGSADLRETYQQLAARVFPAEVSSGSVQVDYELWYPFQWYVRHHQESGQLRFACFKDDSEVGWNATCNPVSSDIEAPALLLASSHGTRDSESLNGFERAGPLRNLLWFPESYRRPREDRKGEGPVEELVKDFAFFKEVATSRDAWSQALDYVIFRDLQRDWYTSEYYSYLP